jgi:fructan beta-fructosidase
MQRQLCAGHERELMKMNPVVLMALGLATVSSLSAAQGELLFPNSDFESGTLENWTAEGDAFTHQPTRGDNASARGRESASLQGDYYIGTFENYDGRTGKAGATRGDGATGTLTSIPFKVTRDYLTFRVGGGSDSSLLGVALLSGGDEIPLFSGFSSETMKVVSSDVSKFRGREVRLKIYDRATKGWGHINADDFRWSDAPLGQTRVAMKLPELEDEWSTFPLYQQVGYDQPLRPQFHFTSRMGWLNDPNGMVYYDGEWHMYFQHYAKGNASGNKSWGNAKSIDLMRWKQFPHAINPYPKVDGSDGVHAIWSGSAVVDLHDSLGKQQGDTKTLFALYSATHSKFFQGGAYSTDRGRTWTKINGGKPVIPHQEGFDKGQRDPRLFYYAPEKCYYTIMMIGGPERKVRLWKSTNLLDWEQVFDIPGKAAECIDMYEVSVDGDPHRKKWVIADAGTHYEVGEFDGKSWKGYGEKDAQGKRLRFDYGDAYYAAQVFNQGPDGRVVHIGWLQSKQAGYRPFLDAGMPFTQQMSIPAEITLRDTPEGIRMYRNPVREIETLYRETHPFEKLSAGNLNTRLKDIRAELVDLTLRAESGKDFTLNIRGLKIDYLAGSNAFRVENRARVEGIRQAWNKEHPFRDNGIRMIPAPPVDGRVTLRALVDRASLELFVNDGAAAASFVMVPDADNRTIAIEGHDDLTIESMVVNELNSIWK